MSAIRMCLCSSTAMETHSYLYFACQYSKTICQKLLNWSGLHRQTGDWTEEMLCVLKQIRHKRVNGEILRSLFAELRVGIWEGQGGGGKGEWRRRKQFGSSLSFLLSQFSCLIKQLVVHKCNECGQVLPESFEPPVDESWTSGIFGCAEDKDSCWRRFFCPCVLFGRNVKSLREDTPCSTPCVCHAIFVEGGIALVAATTTFHVTAEEVSSQVFQLLMANEEAKPTELNVLQLPISKGFDSEALDEVFQGINLIAFDQEKMDSAYGRGIVKLTAIVKARDVAPDACHKALELRWSKFQRNATLLKRQLTWQFNGHLGKKGISGHIKVSYEEKTLSIEVKMPQDASSSSVRDTRGLSDRFGSKWVWHQSQSGIWVGELIPTPLGGGPTQNPWAVAGGERSFSTLCFALALHEMTEAPFRAMDEFDVFMVSFTTWYCFVTFVKDRNALQGQLRTVSKFHKHDVKLDQSFIGALHVQYKATHFPPLLPGSKGT
ncbi:hypothetical protein RND71_028642 [Anisodus tanguticus]|uniref:Uncharacterized protein n=1 Tax=Anisodus tanguticus TaxID=243964 RepID=A0AAE1V9D5_9SOLA|nr:hypothetical protein RND71_028642 [Anisodus tanguticus]